MIVWDVACGVPLQVHSNIVGMTNMHTLLRAVVIVQFLRAELALATLYRTLG